MAYELAVAGDDRRAVVYSGNKSKASQIEVQCGRMRRRKVTPESGSDSSICGVTNLLLCLYIFLTYEQNLYCSLVYE